MQLIPCLVFNGRCEAAFKFYERCLGGKIAALVRHAGTPAEEHVPPEWRDKIMHVRLIAGEAVLMGADAPPDRYKAPQGFSVSLHPKDPAEADRVFNALAENGTVQMPMQPTFWAVRFGMLTDQFGIPWMINCEHSP